MIARFDDKHIARNKFLFSDLDDLANSKRLPCSNYKAITGKDLNLSLILFLIVAVTTKFLIGVLE